MWSPPEVYLLELNNLDVIHREKLDQDACISDLLIVVFENINYLLILLGKKSINLQLVKELISNNRQWSTIESCNRRPY